MIFFSTYYKIVQDSAELLPRTAVRRERLARSPWNCTFHTSRPIGRFTNRKYTEKKDDQ